MVVVNDSGSSNGSGRNDAGASSRVDREWGTVGPVARTDGGK